MKNTRLAVTLSILLLAALLALPAPLHALAGNDNGGQDGSNGPVVYDDFSEDLYLYQLVLKEPGSAPVFTVIEPGQAQNALCAMETAFNGIIRVTSTGEKFESLQVLVTLIGPNKEKHTYLAKGTGTALEAGVEKLTSYHAVISIGFDEKGIAQDIMKSVAKSFEDLLNKKTDKVSYTVTLPRLDQLILTYTYQDSWKTIRVASLPAKLAPTPYTIDNEKLEKILNPLLGHIEAYTRDLKIKLEENNKTAREGIERGVLFYLAGLKHQACEEAKQIAASKYTNVKSVECVDRKDVNTNTKQVIDNFYSGYKELASQAPEKIAKQLTKLVNTTLQQILNHPFEFLHVEMRLYTSIKVYVQGYKAYTDSHQLVVRYSYAPRFYGEDPIPVKDFTKDRKELEEKLKQYILDKKLKQYVKNVSRILCVSEEESNNRENNENVTIHSDIPLSMLNRAPCNQNKLYAYLREYIISNGEGWRTIGDTKEFFLDNAYVILRAAKSKVVNKTDEATGKKEARVEEFISVPFKQLYENKSSIGVETLFQSVDVKVEKEANDNGDTKVVAKYIFNYPGKDASVVNVSKNNVHIPVGLVVPAYPSPWVQYRYGQDLSHDSVLDPIWAEHHVRKKTTLKYSATIVVEVEYEVCHEVNGTTVCETEKDLVEVPIAKSIELLFNAIAKVRGGVDKSRVLVNIYNVEKADIEARLGKLVAQAVIGKVDVIVDQKDLSKEIGDPLIDRSIPVLVMTGLAPLSGSGLLDKAAGTLYHTGKVFDLPGLIELSDKIVQFERDSEAFTAILKYLGLPRYYPIVMGLNSSNLWLNSKHNFDKIARGFLDEIHVLPGEYLGVTIFKGYTYSVEKLYNLNKAGKTVEELLTEIFNIVATFAYDQVEVECTACVAVLDDGFKARSDNKLFFHTGVIGLGYIGQVGATLHGAPGDVLSQSDLFLDPNDELNGIKNGPFWTLVSKLLGKIGEELSKMKIQTLSYIYFDKALSNPKLVKKLTFFTLTYSPNYARFVVGNTSGELIVKLKPPVVVSIAVVWGIPFPIPIYVNPSEEVVKEVKVNVKVYNRVETVPLITRINPYDDTYYIYAMPTVWIENDKGLDLAGLLFLRGPYRPFNGKGILAYKLALVDENRNIVGKPAILSDLGFAFEPITVTAAELDQGIYRLYLVSYQNRTFPAIDRYNHLVFERPDVYLLRYEENKTAQKILVYVARPAEKSYYEIAEENIKNKIENIAFMDGIERNKFVRNVLGKFVEEIKESIIEINENYAKGIDKELPQPTIKNLTDALLGYYKKKFYQVVEVTISELEEMENKIKELIKKTMEKIIQQAAVQVAESILKSITSGLGGKVVGFVFGKIDEEIRNEWDKTKGYNATQSVFYGILNITKTFINEMRNESSLAIRDAFQYTLNTTIEFAAKSIVYKYQKGIRNFVGAINENTDLRDSLIGITTLFFAKARPILMWVAIDDCNNNAKPEMPELKPLASAGLSFMFSRIESLCSNNTEYKVYPLPLVSSSITAARVAFQSLLSSNVESVDRAFSRILSEEFSQPFVEFHLGGTSVGVSAIFKTAANVLELISEKTGNKKFKVIAEKLEKASNKLLDFADKVEAKIAELEDTSKVATLTLYDIGRRVPLPARIELR